MAEILEPCYIGIMEWELLVQIAGVSCGRLVIQQKN